LALIESADAVVTNDTGPMHFSFLLDVPTIAVFTYMSPICWGPPRKDPRFVVLNAPSDSVQDPEGVWMRAVIHYLEALLDRFPRKDR
jgi:ADP-heptose:LPS heptosyltransferase